jgi:hypothetical protein
MSLNLQNINAKRLLFPVVFFILFKKMQASSSPSSTAESGDRPQDTPPIPDPFDLEFDRFNGGLMADIEGTARTQRQPLDPLSRPIDLEFELDRDDPEAVDMDLLYESPDEGDEGEMGMSMKGAVDLDDEYDL